MTNISDAGDRAVLSRRPHLPQAFPLQVADRCQRAQTQLHPAGGGLDGRVRQVLLPEGRQRIGEEQYC
jgi:hypothetical protein